MAGIIAKSYADALYDLANEEQILDEIKQELAAVDEEIRHAVDFFRILTHPRIHKDEKKASLETVFGNQIHHTLLNFLKLLIDKGRFQNLHEIQRAFVKRYNQEHDIVVAHVRSAQKLSVEEADRLHAMLVKKLNKKVDICFYEEPSLLAGVRIKINDMVLDNSALSKMENLKQLAQSTEFNSDADKKVRGECR